MKLPAKVTAQRPPLSGVAHKPLSEDQHKFISEGRERHLAQMMNCAAIDNQQCRVSYKGGIYPCSDKV